MNDRTQLGWLHLVLLLGLASPSEAWVQGISHPSTRWPRVNQPALYTASNDAAPVESSAAAAESSGDSTITPPTGVTLKVAFDLNWGVAEMADDVSVRFTCGDSLDMVHRLRRDSDAVLVGRGTVERDDCTLTVRRGVEPTKQPLRVILDPRLSLVLAELNEGVQYEVLTDGLPTVIYHCVSDVQQESLSLMESVTLVCMEPGELSNEEEDEQSTDPNRPGMYFSSKSVVDHLKEHFQVRHLMVEGGPRTTMNFLQDDLIDRVIMVRPPISFVEPYPSGMTAVFLEEAGLENVGTRTSGVDTIDYWARPGLSWPTDPIGDWP